MKPSKQREAESLEVYKTYFEKYIEGDTDGLVSMLAEEYTQIGSAEVEVYFSRKEAIEFIYDTIDQVAGKAEMRNRIIKVEAFGEFFLFSDLFDMYVLIEEGWTFYGKLRASTFMAEKEGEWKMIHQHSSFPDMRAVEGENIAIEKISAENIQLRDAVKRRTTELEIKTRELEFESSLERVRSVAMGMRKPADLLDICETLYAELQSLGFEELRNAMINIHNDVASSFVNYDYSDEIGKSINHLVYDIHPVIENQIRQMRSSTDGFSETVFEGAQLEAMKAFRKEIGEKDDPRIEQTDALYYYFYSIGTGSIGISTFEPIGAEKLQFLKRFRNVFDFAYQKFLDVTLAEAQTREAMLEASLERVRTVAMGMRKPEDMLEVCKMISQQLAKLGIKEIRNVQTAIFYESRGTYMNYEYYAKHDKTFITEVDFKNHPIHFAFAKKMMKGPNEEVLEHLSGKELLDWYDYQKTTNQFADTFLLTADSLNYYWYSLGPVALGISTYYQLTLEETILFKRFLKVFELAYSRYFDIEKAEAQAREAKIEAALERVRGRSMAMHKSDELAELSLELVKQVQALGVATWFCAFNIYDDNEQSSLEWGSNGQGTFPKYRTPRESIFLRYYEAGQGGETFLINEIDEKQCPAHYEYLCSLPILGNQLLKMKEAGIPFPAQQMDHVAYFKYGYIIFITYEPVPEAHDIFKRFAKVFEQTYTRFLDLQKVEAQAMQAEQDLVAIKEAKQKAEDALTELRATQTQLIQSEKMASLGELTAGIAHEIQNPLNFVNNFSELNSELIVELKDELEKGNLEEAKNLAGDIDENEQKILHHGKRADAIVKGMLQHSRSSSGKKEPTDINALADEYLRLAYHGLRAKDKSFNAKMETDFDESISKINVIPQDIGRVILNLITNAFYVVDEKKKQTDLEGFKNLLGLSSYEPMVSVSTQRIGDQIEIKVKDNGNGIPEKVLDKIFQPFFTTKPTGQGTGLGLSLSYDIVKAHGGELKVETEEGKGTSFTVKLP